MTRAADMTLDRVVKYEWPGTPELEVETIDVSREEGESEFFTTKKIIVSATSNSGESWTGTEPPKILGWTITCDTISPP